MSAKQTPSSGPRCFVLTSPSLRQSCHRPQHSQGIWHRNEREMGDESPGSASHRSFSDTSSKRKQKKRVRNWTASDRARHRVFEKGRREAFNERLMVSMNPCSRHYLVARAERSVGSCASLTHPEQCKGEPVIEARYCRRKREIPSNSTSVDRVPATGSGQSPR
jgi:hypothetical protein